MGVYIWNRLPSEYQEVEYIQSSGTQFIDTGYLITPTTEVSIDYQYINANNQDFAFGVGSDNNTSSGMTFCSYIGKTGGVTYFKAGLSDGTGSSTFTNNGPGVDTNRHKFVLNNGHFLTYNSSGTLQKDVTTSATFTRTATHSFGLFCWWRTDTSARDNKTSAKLYGCEVKDNGVLQRHFVPCYRKSDSVIGLYDLVNNQFYTNAGSGTFTKGNDVNNYYEKVMKNAYIGEVWTPTSNTLLYCPLDDDLLDHSGNHTMTKTDTTYGTIAKDSTGFYHFTGGYLASESYTGPTQGTISVWVKRENKSTGETTLQRGFGIQYTGSSPFYNMAFEFNKSYYITTGTGTAHFINVGASTLNTWELWTATFSSATGGKMYKNGVLVDSFSDSNNLWSANGYSFIGGNAYGGVNTGLQYFKGYLSDAIIENKVRTAEEITNYYNNTKANYGL